MRARTVDVVIETIVEQVYPIASAWIGRANPEATTGFNRRVSMPGHFLVTPQSKNQRQVVVPAMPVLVNSVWTSILGQKIIVLRRKELSCQPPLFQIVQATGGFSCILSSI